MDTIRSACPSRAMARAAAGAALLPALALAAAAPAAAHDELVRTAPAEGATVTEAPDEVTLTFSGDLIDGQGIQNLMQVRDADGNQWQSGTGTVSGPQFTVPLCEDLPNGEYDVAYRVVYSDGHSEERSYTFSVDAPDAPAAGTVPSGCGVAAAAPASEGASSAAASAGSEAGQDEPAAAASSDAAETQDPARSEDRPGVPGWVWAVGLGGLAVLGLGFLLMGRKARALGHR